MKKTMYFLVATMLAAGTILIGCKSSAEHEAKEKAEEMKEAQGDYAEDMQKFRDESNAKISAYEVKIAELKAKAAKVKKEAKADYNKTIAEIEQRNTTLKSNLAEFKADSKDRWVTFKQDFSHSMDELGTTFKNVTYGDDNDNDDNDNDNDVDNDNDNDVDDNDKDDK